MAALRYDDLIAEYGELRRENESRAREKANKLYADHPALGKNRDLLRENAVAIAKAKITESSLLPELTSTRDALKAEREALLQDLGLTEDDFLPVYRCPDCQDTGYLGQAKCHCFRLREAKLLYENSHLGAVLEKENFSTLRTDVYSRIPGKDGVSTYDRMEKLVSYCHRFTDGFASEKRSILFYGNSGVGKTFFSNCIAKELMDKGFSVLYFSAISLFETLSKIRFSRAEDDSLPDTSWLYDCDLLIIDDLGTELVNSFVESEFFHIVNERILGRKSTVISTNLNPSSLSDRYTERTASRIISTYDIIQLTGEDIRNKIKEMALVSKEKRP